MDAGQQGSPQPPPVRNAPPPPPPLISTLLDNPETLTAIRAVREHFSRVRTEEVEDVPLTDAIFDAAQLASVLLTGCNGGTTIPVQRVQVEYLRSNQTMRIPQGLGINPDNPNAGRATNIPTLLARMKKVANMDYEEIRTAVDERMPFAQLRALVEDSEPLILGNNATWLTRMWVPTLASGQVDSTDSANVVYTYLSQALQMNFDIRDFGILNLTAMSKPDNAWTAPMSTDTETPVLPNYLKAYSLQQIAALNYAAVSGSGLAAWTRAYGVGCGILPAPNTATVREYKFTKLFADTKDADAVIAFEKSWGEPLITPCLNILAAFGLLHLNKDHTFKTGDANMERINAAYFKALEFVSKSHHRTAILQHPEAIIRTGPHPFGLGQTYFVARCLAASGRLAPALAVRIDVSPPPVQRIMIAHAVAKEWKTLPAGEDLNVIYGPTIETINNAKALIDANPPAYSHLAKVYGLPDITPPPEAGMNAANTLMPCIYGFAMAVHSEDGQKKSGVALALSLDNVKKDNALLTTCWVSAWEKMTDSIEKDGMEGFLRDMVKTARASQPPQVDDGAQN